MILDFGRLNTSYRTKIGYIFLDMFFKFLVDVIKLINYFLRGGGERMIVIQIFLIRLVFFPPHY